MQHFMSSPTLLSLLSMGELILDPDISYFFESGHDKTHSLYETNMDWLDRVKSKIIVKRIMQDTTSLRECSFKPGITNRGHRTRRCFWERLADDDAMRRIAKRLRRHEKLKTEHDPECTFRPRILERSSTTDHSESEVKKLYAVDKPTCAIPRINPIPRRMASAIRYASIPVYDRLYRKAMGTCVAVPIEIPLEFNL